jgi:hypothetical protein
VPLGIGVQLKATMNVFGSLLAAGAAALPAALTSGEEPAPVLSNHVRAYSLRAGGARACCVRWLADWLEWRVGRAPIGGRARAETSHR